MLSNLKIMINYKVQQAFKRAKRRWSDICWPMEFFIAHITNARKAGNEPVYLEDMYLAGAAGYRFDTAWIVIEDEISQTFKAIMSQIPSSDMTPDELWSETLTRLLDEDASKPKLADGSYPAKIVRYHGLIKLINYFVTVSRRIAIQRNRKRKEDLYVSTVEDSIFSGNKSSPEQNIIESEMRTLAVEKLTKALQNLSAEQKFLIMMVYRQGMKQKKAGALLGWSEFKVCRHLKSAIEQLRQSVCEVEGTDLNCDLSDVLDSLCPEDFETRAVGKTIGRETL